MSVQVYGVNHVAIEVDNAQKAVEFYADVFNLEMLRGGEGNAWCKLGEHQFLAIFEVETLHPDRSKHFGIMVRDEAQIAARPATHPEDPRFVSDCPRDPGSHTGSPGARPGRIFS